MNNIYLKKDILEKEVARLEKADISEEQRKTILRFHTHLSANGCGEQRIVKLSWQLRKIALILKKPFEEATKEDIEYVVAKINTSRCENKQFKDKPLSISTKRDYNRVLKQFYKWIRGVKNSPPEVDWLKTKLKLSESALKFDLITWDDVNKCVEKLTSLRTIALIVFLYESGARVGEILGMKNQDIKFKKNYAKIRLSGKTGERWIPIIIATPYLRQYFNSKQKISDSSYFWENTSNNANGLRLNYPAARKILKKTFEKAGIEKRSNFHSYRHSRATELAKTLTEPQLRLFFGWERGSEIPAIYTHLSGRDINKTILSMHGLISHEDQDENKSRMCGLCDTINRPKANFCSKCGYGLTTKSVMELEDRKTTDINDAMNYFMEIAKSPELLRKFEEFKKKAEGDTK